MAPLVDSLGRPLRARGGPADGRRLREQLRREQETSLVLSERLAELELALEDSDWTRLDSRLDRFEFSREAQLKITRLSRLAYIKNPIIQRAVNVRAYYTFGRGIEVTAKDERVNEVIQATLSDVGNREEMFSHRSRLLTDVELGTDGNLFLVLFTNPITGRVRIRSFPVEEIVDCAHDPEDWARIRFWRRSSVIQTLDYASGAVKSETVTTWHPDWRYEPQRAKPLKIGLDRVRWDAPVMHVKSGGTKRMRYGVPETYAALDWARAHKEFLEDWATVVASLARFSWQLSTKGSQVAAAKSRLASSVTEHDFSEENPPPVAGSFFVQDEATDITPIPKTGAHTTAEDGRQLRLMVGAAMDLPDTILSGDADVGNHATAKTLDRPTELALESRQKLWADVYRDLMQYAVDRAARATGGVLKGTVSFDDDSPIVEHESDTIVDVTFPSILEHDVINRIRAIVEAATLSGRVESGTLPREVLVRLLATELGVQDVEEVVAQTLADQSQFEALAVQAAARGSGQLVPGRPPQAEPDSEDEGK